MQIQTIDSWDNLATWNLIDKSYNQAPTVAKRIIDFDKIYIRLLLTVGKNSYKKLSTPHELMDNVSDYQFLSCLLFDPAARNCYRIFDWSKRLDLKNSLYPGLLVSSTDLYQIIRDLDGLDKLTAFL